MANLNSDAARAAVAAGTNRIATFAAATGEPINQAVNDFHRFRPVDALPTPTADLVGALYLYDHLLYTVRAEIRGPTPATADWAVVPNGTDIGPEAANFIGVYTPNTRPPAVDGNLYFDLHDGHFYFGELTTYGLFEGLAWVQATSFDAAVGVGDWVGTFDSQAEATAAPGAGDDRYAVWNGILYTASNYVAAVDPVTIFKWVNPGPNATPTFAGEWRRGEYHAGQYVRRDIDGIVTFWITPVMRAFNNANPPEHFNSPWLKMDNVVYATNNLPSRSIGNDNTLAIDTQGEVWFAESRRISPGGSAFAATYEYLTEINSEFIGEFIDDATATAGAPVGGAPVVGEMYYDITRRVMRVWVADGYWIDIEIGQVLPAANSLWCGYFTDEASALANPHILAGRSFAFIADDPLGSGRGAVLEISTFAPPADAVTVREWKYLSTAGAGGDSQALPAGGVEGDILGVGGSGVRGWLRPRLDTEEVIYRTGENTVLGTNNWIDNTIVSSLTGVVGDAISGISIVGAGATISEAGIYTFEAYGMHNVPSINQGATGIAILRLRNGVRTYFRLNSKSGPVGTVGNPQNFNTALSSFNVEAGDRFFIVLYADPEVRTVAGSSKVISNAIYSMRIIRLATVATADSAGGGVSGSGGSSGDVSDVALVQLFTRSANVPAVPVGVLYGGSAGFILIPAGFYQSPGEVPAGVGALYAVKWLAAYDGAAWTLNSGSAILLDEFSAQYSANADGADPHPVYVAETDLYWRFSDPAAGGAFSPWIALNSQPTQWTEMCAMGHYFGAANQVREGTVAVPVPLASINQLWMHSEMRNSGQVQVGRRDYYFSRTLLNPVLPTVALAELPGTYIRGSTLRVDARLGYDSESGGIYQSERATFNITSANGQNFAFRWLPIASGDARDDIARFAWYDPGGGYGQYGSTRIYFR